MCVCVCVCCEGHVSHFKGKEAKSFKYIIQPGNMLGGCYFQACGKKIYEMGSVSLPLTD